MEPGVQGPQPVGASQGPTTPASISSAQAAQIICNLQQQVADLHTAYQLSSQQLQETRDVLQQLSRERRDAARPGAHRLKLPKPPETNGRQPEPVNWCYKMEAYLLAEGTNVDSNEAITIAAAFLTDGALNWYRQYEQEVQRGLAQGFGSWAQFKAAFITRFTHVDPESRARDKLEKLYQSRSVFAYAQEFNSCMLELPRMEEHDRIYRFIKGLKPELRIHVRMQNPDTLAKTIQLAIQADEMVRDVHPFGMRGMARNVGYSKPFVGRLMAGSSGGPTPMELGAVDAKVGRPRRELADQGPPGYSQIKCFCCGKLGHIRRNCFKYKKQCANGTARSN